MTLTNPVDFYYILPLVSAVWCFIACITCFVNYVMGSNNRKG